MGVLEKLVPFVHFGQFVGLFPYCIKTNPFTGRFKGFFFSWCHKVTLWFALSFVLQFLLLIVQVVLSQDVLTDLNILNNMPFTLTAVYGLTTINHYLMMVVSRLITLRFKQFRVATDSIIVDVVRSLEELESLPNCRNTAKSRTFVGILFIFILVIGNVVLFNAIGGNQAMTDSYGAFFALLNLCFYSFALMSNDSTLLLFHLSFYCLAHHIQLLRAQLTSYRLSIAVNQSDLPYPKDSRKVLLHLQKAFAALCSLFSFPVLLVLVNELCMIALNLFGFVYFLVKPNTEFTLAGLQITLFMVITSAVRVFIILHAADMPVYQIRYFREQIIAAANRRLQNSTEDHLRIQSLLQHSEEERFRLKAAGLFQVGTHLLPAVTGSIVTYLVILLQYELNN